MRRAALLAAAAVAALAVGGASAATGGTQAQAHAQARVHAAASPPRSVQVRLVEYRLMLSEAVVRAGPV